MTGFVALSSEIPYQRVSSLFGIIIGCFHHDTLLRYTGTLYPYDIVEKALDVTWNALEDYAPQSNALCVIDGSGSMYWGGTITPECDGNWRVTGNDWDAGLHQEAVELLAEGKLVIPFSEDGRADRS